MPEPWHDNYQDFCIYCQRKFATMLNLVKHIEKKHPGTYAEEYVAKPFRETEPKE